MRVFTMGVRAPYFEDVRLNDERTDTVIAVDEDTALKALKRLALTEIRHRSDRDDVLLYRNSLIDTCNQEIMAMIKFVQNLIGSLKLNCVVVDGEATADNLSYFDVSEGERNRVITFKVDFPKDDKDAGVTLKSSAVAIAEHIITRF